jgi:predicted permease
VASPQPVWDLLVVAMFGGCAVGALAHAIMAFWTDDEVRQYVVVYYCSSHSSLSYLKANA